MEGAHDEHDVGGGQGYHMDEGGVPEGNGPRV